MGKLPILQYSVVVVVVVIVLFIDSADVECTAEAQNARRGHTAGAGHQIQTEGCGGTNRSVSVCDIEHSLLVVYLILVIIANLW